MRKPSALLPWLNALGLIATLAVNSLANIIPFNGQTTGEISDAFPTLFTPAGYVFAIWSLIYLGLLAFSVYQLLPAQRSDSRLGRVGYWFALSCLANSLWILAWHYEQFAISLGLMLVLLVSLIMCYLRLDINRTAVSRAQRWLVDAPFSLYLGWISVATIANVSVLLVSLDWQLYTLPEPIWATIMLIIAAVLGFLVYYTRADAIFVGVLIWAFAGIAVKQTAFPPAPLFAGSLATILAVLIIAGALRLLPRLPKQPSP